MFLASRGWRVHAIDGSRVGIQRMLDEAYTRGVSQRIEAEVADLEAPGFKLEREYDLICDFYFLHRPLFEEVRRALKPGGLFAAAIHVGAGRFSLAPGELQTIVRSWGWTILHEREAAPAESGHHRDTVELIARKP
jgi:SAM-dependent methyltransferase